MTSKPRQRTRIQQCPRPGCGGQVLWQWEDLTEPLARRCLLCGRRPNRRPDPPPPPPPPVAEERTSDEEMDEVRTLARAFGLSAYIAEPEEEEAR